MTKAPDPTSPRQFFYSLASFVLVVVVLYWGQKILIPVALAVLLTFLLAPLVTRLQRRGVRRTPSVLLVVALAFSVIGTVGWLLTAQVADLINELPAHKGNLERKIADLRGTGKAGPLANVQDFLEAIDRAGRAGSAAAVPVVRLQPERPSLFAQIQTAAGAFMGPLSSSLVVVVLVISMLRQREELRNRIVRLAGRGRLALTTQALDEVGRRIGTYLLRHSLVNAGFGVGVGVGLWLLGLPYAGLWGFLAGALRFLPSIGPWLVAPFPAVLALSEGPGWTQPALVLLLFLALGQLNSSVIEPWLCGPTIGVAAVPLIVSVLFWGWIWGLTGVILATPLTVCVAVLGKYVPHLEFLGVLLGTAPALGPAVSYYQRLLARDRAEAAEIVESHLRENSVGAVYDDILVPALGLVKAGRESGELSREHEQFILQVTRELLASLGGPAPPAVAADGEAGPARAKVWALGFPAHGPVDELALLLFQHSLQTARCGVLLTDTQTPPAELTSLIERKEAVLVFIAAVAPGGLEQTGYLCKRLRTRFPDLKIVVGRWGLKGGLEKTRNRLLAAGADRVTPTLAETLEQVNHLIHLPAEEGAPSS